MSLPKVGHLHLWPAKRGVDITEVGKASSASRRWIVDEDGVAHSGSGIGARLRAARHRSGLSREALAFHSGLSWSAVTSVEAGRRKNIRPDTLAGLAGALGVTTDYLVGARPLPPTMFQHEATFYEDDDALAAAAIPFITTGIERSEAVLVAAPGEKLSLLKRAIGSRFRGIEMLNAESFYDDPTRAVSEFKKFASEQLASGRAWVRILAEPPWTGSSPDEIRVLELIESVLNLSFALTPITMLCPYDARMIHPDVVKAAHATHSRIISGDGSSENDSYQEPMRYVLKRQAELSHNADLGSGNSEQR